MRPRSGALFCFLFFLLLAPHVTAAEETPPHVITLKDALALAMQNNASIAVARAQVDEAWYTYLAAGSLPNTTLNVNAFSGTNTIITSNGFAADLNATLAQDFGAFGNIAAQARAAHYAWEAARANLTETRTTVSQNVRDGFFNLLSAQESAHLARDTQVIAQDIYDKSVKRFKAGAGPRMDVVSAQIQLASSSQALITAEGALKQARASLTGTLGLPPTDPLQVQAPLELPAIDPTLQSLLDIAHQTRGAVLAAQATLSQAIAQVRVVETQYHPDLALSYLQDLSSSNPNLHSTQLGVTWPFLDLGQERNQVKVQQQTVVEKQAALKSTLQTLDATIAGALETYKAAYLNASAFRQEVLEPSQTLMQMTQFGFDKGALTYLQVLNAQQTLKQARSQYIALLQSGHQALDALEAAVGTTVQGDNR